MSEYTRHPCPNCTSSDGYTIYKKDGHGWCYVCEYRSKATKDVDDMLSSATTMSKNVKPITASTGNVESIPDRKIKAATAKKYGVRVVKDSDTDEILQHLYPYHDNEGNYIMDKIRTCPKNFSFSASGQMGDCGLFGQHLFKGGGKYVTITEGELDALSAYEMLGSKWPVVSIKNGAKGAFKTCQEQFAYLDSFEKIVLCLDADAEGKRAARDVADMFGPSKVLIVTLEDFKDASDFLVNGASKKFIDQWWNAKTYTPEGIINLKDLGDSLYEENDYVSIPYPWQGLNDKTYGIRTGELVTITAGTGTGKSSLIRELEHHILTNTTENIGVISLEENVKTTAFHLMSVQANARIYIREERQNYKTEDLKKWQEETIGTGRFFAFDHFGSLETEKILNKVRQLIKAFDCRWVFLDHLSILVSGLEGEDERRNIDVLMTKLRSIVEETQCSLLLVSHLRRVGGDRGHENGVEVNLSHLRGSQSIAQLSDIVIAAERNQQSPDPIEANTTVLRVLKNRYSGETGICSHLLYDRDTGRLKEQEDFDAINNEAEGSEDNGF